MGTEGIQDKYVNPYTDFGFKLLFGTAMNKELLISFLNALLFKEEVIKDVTYLNAEHLGTQEFPRVRIGVGEKPPGWDLADHVLSRFPCDEEPLVREALQDAAAACKVIMAQDINAAMNQFN